MDFWIGDLVVLPSGRVGKYEGKNKDGKARVNVDGKIVVADHEKISTQDIEKQVSFDVDAFLNDLIDHESEVSKKSSYSRIKVNKYLIDLHIDKLNPSLKNDGTSKISDYQIKAFRDFIDEAYTNRRSPVTVVHGRGEGILRNEIHSILDHDHRVGIKKLINNGGATEVWLRFM